MFNFLSKKYNGLRLWQSRRVYPAHIPRVVQANINGYEMLVLVNEDVGRWISVLGKYEERDSKFLSANLRDTDICVDVGANTGYFTVLMAKIAWNGQVHAFEPVPLNYHLLCSTALLNHLPNVHLNHCAVGENEGESMFSVAEDGAYSSMMPTGRRPENSVTKVSVVNLDNYLSVSGIAKIDVMKVDVEGAEGLVIKGGASVLSNPETQPRLIMLELQDINFKMYGTSVEKVVKLMGEFGYSPFFVGEDGIIYPFERESYNVICNVFFKGRFQVPSATVDS